MQASLFDPAVSLRLVQTLAHFVWQGAAVFGFAALALLALRRATARTRYACLLAAMLVMTACPIGTFVWLGAHTSVELPAAASRAAAAVRESGREGRVDVPPRQSESVQRLAGPPVPTFGDTTVNSGTPAKPIADNHMTRPADLSWRSRVELGLRQAAPYALICYLLGTALMFGRLLLAVYGGRRLLRRSAPVDDADLLAALSRQARRLGLRCTPTVAYCTHVLVPTVVGAVRPMVLLPITLATGLTGEQIEMLLAHELAHIRRYDHLVNMLQRVVESVLFFHPAVWWISKHIRAEREHCCDDLVLAGGGTRLAYAESLVRMVELSRRVRAAPLLPALTLGADGGRSKLHRRIARLLSPEVREPMRLLRGWTVLALIASATLLAGIAQLACLESERAESSAVVVKPASGLQEATTTVPAAGASTAPTTGVPSPSEAESEEVAAESAARRIRGQVVVFATDEPIAGALVRLASPSGDMRRVRTDPGQRRIVEGRTDAEGRFALALPQDAGNNFTLDAFAKGYESAAGTFQGGGLNLFTAPISLPAAMQFREHTLRLRPALYVAGVVRDRDGAPLANVDVQATERASSSTGYIANARTDDRGRFEIFDFPDAERRGQPEARGQIDFKRADRQRATVANVYALNAGEREHLGIVMPAGERVSGRVLDASGNPAARALVEAITPEYEDREETRTGPDGTFEFVGLPAGPVRLRCHVLESKEKGELTIDAGDTKSPVTLLLQVVRLSEPVETVELLGMKVANVTPELKTVYDLHQDQGVVILDPGSEPGRLGIGRLAEGYRFWIVGNKRIVNVEDFVSEMLRIHAKPQPKRGGMVDEGHHAMIRVVYDMRGGSNTQYLRLTDEDAASLQALADKMGLQIEAPSGVDEDEALEEPSYGPRAPTPQPRKSGATSRPAVPATKASPTVDSPPSPTGTGERVRGIIERDVNADAVGTDCVIDLDTGKLHTPKADAGMSFPDWFKKSGIDMACTVEAASPGLWGFDMVVIPAAADVWESMAADPESGLSSTLRSHLENGTLATPAVMSAAGPLPATYLFRTREGSLGVLQILAIGRASKSEHIKIRYRLLGKTSGPA